MLKGKNILFFVSSLNSGGIENYLLRFLQYKANSFKSIIVFCKSGKGGQLEERYKNNNNVLIYKKAISFFNPLDYVFIYNFYKKNDIHSVCDFTGNFAGLTLFSAKLACVRKRVTFYRSSNNRFKETKFRKLYSHFVKFLAYSCSTDILANSEAGLDFFFPKRWRTNIKFNVIYNGVDSNSFTKIVGNIRSELNVPTDAFIIGHTGRFNEAKNHTTILKVAFELIEEYDDIYFLLCGNTVKDNLQMFLKENKMENRIILQNYRSDIPKILNTMDCYFFPSISEGQPNALIEAMISGLPFVASNIPSHKETIPESHYGQLVDPLDVCTAKIKLLRIKENKSVSTVLNLKEWAIKRYNPENLFDQFYKKLI